MYVDSERHRKLFSLRLWCKQDFDYDVLQILQIIFYFKMGCTYIVLYFDYNNY